MSSAVALFLSLLSAADCANVLVFMPLPLKSHVAGFRPMLDELANRGHNVTVVSAFPSADRRVANYTDIGVTPSTSIRMCCERCCGRGCELLMRVHIESIYVVRHIDVMQLTKRRFFNTVTSRWAIANLLSSILNDKNIKDFIRSDSNSYDLVIIESFLQEYTVTLGHKFNAPVINLSPAMVWVSMSKWLHIPSTFSYIPDCCIGVTDEMTFVDRLKNTVIGVLQMYVENYYYMPMMKAIMNEHFKYDGWESRPPLEQMLNNVSVTLMNAHHAIGPCRPYLPGVVEVGGMHIKEPKPLPQDLQDFISSATSGVIFFSFGSMVNVSKITNEKVNIFFNVIGKLKQQVILKWNPDVDVTIPQNVITSSWFPQADILAHPNVKLFITHGGFHSIEEAVYNAKPVVGIPFFADQLSNVRFTEKKGFGRLVTFSELTEESFGNAINEVLSNPTFKKNAVIQSQIYKDQPMKPLDRAIYWTEYVIRNNGAKYLISDSVGLNDAQHYMFDVITLVLLVPTGLITWLCYCGVIKLKSKFKTN